MKHHVVYVLCSLAAGLCVLAGAAPPVAAVSCPGGGALVDIVIHNPAPYSVSWITVSGSSISNELTCTNAAGSYSQAVPQIAPGGNQTVTVTGLATGQWVHHINAALGSGYDQYQQGPVIFSSGSAPRARVDWTFFPNAVKVTQAGDAAGGSCPFQCTLRNALTLANSLASGPDEPVLIWFGVSPGDMAQSAPLKLAGAGYITIDGTDANGNPWIVGDANAFAAGSQDSFPIFVDLQNKTHLLLSSGHNTIMGLDIRNTVGSGEQNHHLIESANVGSQLRAVRLNGGNTFTCAFGDCGGQFDLVRALAGDVTLTNVEGHSAIRDGVALDSNVIGDVTNSWLHNNYKGNVDASGADSAVVERSMIESAGLLRGSDGVVVDTNAYGVFTTSFGAVQTEANVIRNNVADGLKASGFSNLNLRGDYLCGNGAHGLHTTSSGGGLPSVLGLGGLVTAYNFANGVNVALDSHTAVNLNNDSAFPSNGECGFNNTTPSTPASATNNQWRGSPPFPDICVPGSVDVDPVQNADSVPITLNVTQATVPSNVILKGQTIRVQGTGFNAIDGNPLPSGCNVGADLSSLATSCCRQPARANFCGTGPHPDPQVGKGNCVELKDRSGAWRTLSVTSVTPTTIVTEIPDSVFACIGEQGEMVSVSKRRPDTGDVIMDLGGYCTNANPL